MKKLSAIALAMIIASLTLAGCNNNSTNPSDTNQSSDLSTSNENSTSSTESTSSDDSNSDILPSLPGDDDPGDESFPTAAETLEFSDTRAGKLAKAGVSTHADSWSGMMYIPTDPEEIKVIFYNIDSELCEDYCFVTDMTGISGQEILVAKAKTGSEEALKTLFDDYFEFINGPDNFLYPAGQEAVSGAVRGTTDDGYLYIVVHEKGADIADAMVK